jgi:hypothetical protein
MRLVKIASVVVAVHLILLGFFFFKPPLNYFGVTCLSTVIVWAIVFATVKRKRWLRTLGGSLILIAIQQAAYHTWLSAEAGFCWPLVQFLSLQYVVALRLGSSMEDTLWTPESRR